MISTKGRYSIRVLLDLAEHRSGDFIPMKEVAARQDISLKYIERLMPALKAAGLVESVHGIGGGYRLTREPEDYTLWEILELAEGDLAPVTCLQPGRPGVPAGRGVPDAGRVAGVLQADAGLFLPHHAGGSDERPSRGQLRDMSKKRDRRAVSFFAVSRSGLIGAGESVVSGAIGVLVPF